MRKSLPLLMAVLVLFGAARLAVAHELRPGFLELRENGPDTYNFLWKKPSGGEVEIYIAPIIPEECRLTTPGRRFVIAPRRRQVESASAAPWNGSPQSRSRA